MVCVCVCACVFLCTSMRKTWVVNCKQHFDRNLSEVIDKMIITDLKSLLQTQIINYTCTNHLTHTHKATFTHISTRGVLRLFSHIQSLTDSCVHGVFNCWCKAGSSDSSSKYYFPWYFIHANLVNLCKKTISHPMVITHLLCNPNLTGDWCMRSLRFLCVGDFLNL